MTTGVTSLLLTDFVRGTLSCHPLEAKRLHSLRRGHDISTKFLAD